MTFYGKHFIALKIGLHSHFQILALHQTPSRRIALLLAAGAWPKGEPARRLPQEEIKQFLRLKQFEVIITAVVALYA